jgi:DNA primase
MIAPASVEEVIQRADIIEIVGQFVRLKKRGTNYIANCPFHNEKTPSFSVSSAKGIYKCFGCGRGGNVVTFVQEHEKLTFVESIRWLADYYKIILEETERSPEQVQSQQVEESLRVLNEFATQYFTETLLNTEEGQAIGLSYFRQRGLHKDTIKKFRLGYSPEANDTFFRNAISKGYNPELLIKSGLIKDRNGIYYDAYRGRVIFPIQGMTGRVLGFGARILKSNDKAPKYINTPENELYIKSRVLYGLYQSRQTIAKSDECFLVEGYLDVISLHQAGVENVVASSGTALTEDQLRSIGQLTKNLTILYDGDAAGVKAALRGLDMALGQSFNVQLVLLPLGEDPDSYVQKHGKTGIEAYIKAHKQNVIGFRLEVGMKEAGTDPVRKSKLVNEVAESISRINKAEDFSLQQHYIKESSRRLEVDEEGFIALVNKYIRDRIETEQRHKRREDDRQMPDGMPKPPIMEDGTAALPVAETEAGHERQEWQLLRMLLEYGERHYEGYENVADLVYHRIDPELIEAPLAREFYSLYFNYVAEHSKPPSMQYFISHPEHRIGQRAAMLLQNNVEISPNWKENYGIESLHGEHNYLNDADSTLAWFEVKKIKKLETMLMQKLRDEKDPKRLERLTRKFMELKQKEKEVIERHGTVVIKGKFD